jgi:large subunit ribosomal protein L7A
VPLDDLKQASRVIGAKQVKKAITRGIASKVFIACDAEPHVVEPIKQLCQQHQVEIEMVTSKKALGKPVALMWVQQPWHCLTTTWGRRCNSANYQSIGKKRARKNPEEIDCAGVEELPAKARGVHPCLYHNT